MKCNMVPLDAAIRVGLGLALVASPLLELGTYPYSLLGLVPLLTGLVGYCPLYSAARALTPQRGGHSKPVASHG
jgi:hypothetical protein